MGGQLCMYCVIFRVSKHMTSTGLIFALTYTSHCLIALWPKLRFSYNTTEMVQCLTRSGLAFLHTLNPITEGKPTVKCRCAVAMWSKMLIKSSTGDCWRYCMTHCPGSKQSSWEHQPSLGHWCTGDFSYNNKPTHQRYPMLLQTIWRKSMQLRMFLPTTWHQRPQAHSLMHRCRTERCNSRPNIPFRMKKKPKVDKLLAMPKRSTAMHRSKHAYRKSTIPRYTYVPACYSFIPFICCITRTLFRSLDH